MDLIDFDFGDFDLDLDFRDLDLDLLLNDNIIYIINIIININNIKWRKERNVGDMGDRNFMRVGGRVYSVDEAIKRGGEVSLLRNMKKRKYEYVKRELKKMGYEIE